MQAKLSSHFKQPSQKQTTEDLNIHNHKPEFEDQVELQEIKSDETSPMKTDTGVDDHLMSRKKLDHQHSINVAKLFNVVGGIQTGGLEDGTKAKLEFEKLQIFDISILFAAIIGTSMTVLAYDVQFDSYDYEGNTDLLYALIWIVFVSTKLSILLVVFRYLQKLKYLKARKLISEKEDLFTSGEIWYLLGEVIALLIQPYPFIVDVKIHDYRDTEEDRYYFYYANDILSVLITVRIYALGRVILNHTVYRSPRARRLNTLYGANNDYLYAFKCLMKKRPFLCVTLVFGFSIFILGYMLRICERPLNRSIDETMNFKTYWNTMWCVILTMTTVGYGDYYPRTHFGRLITFFCCIWGVFVVSLMVVTLNNTLTMSKSEEKALTVLERLEIRKTIKSQAIDVLSSVAKIRVNHKKLQGSSKKLEAENSKLVRNIKSKLVDFKQNSRQIRELGDEGNVIEKMSKQFDFMNERMDTLAAQQQNLFAAIQNLTEALETKKIESITRVPDLDIPAPRQLPYSKNKVSILDS